MRTAVQVLIDGAPAVLIDGAPAPEPPVNKPAFVWPPGGNQREMELPDVGLLTCCSREGLGSTPVSAP